MKQTMPAELGFSPARLDRINTRMRWYVDNGLLAGMVTLVERRGRVVHFGQHGWQDIEAQKPIRPDTIFRIYSMTKPITCVALMMLYEQALFQLNDPIHKFLPEFKPVRVWAGGGKRVAPARPITIHDLLTHTAGLSYGGYEGTGHPVDRLYDEADLFDPQILLGEMVRRIAKLPLIHSPGSAWFYSVATDVVGYLVEVLSDMPLAGYMQARIFDPLGMEDTAFRVHPDQADRFATLYGKTGQGDLQVLDTATGGDYFNVRLHAGGHGLVSTAADFLRFARLVRNGGELGGTRLLGRKTVELMTLNHLPQALLPLRMGDPWPGFGYGLGFGVLVDLAQSGIMGSVGNVRWSGYANTHFWIDPQEDLIGMLLLQYLPGGTHPVTDDFKTLVYQALVD